MILTATPPKTMKRVVVVVVHNVAARAPFQRKTTLSALHRALFLSLSSFTLSLSLALNRNKQQPTDE
jgi:hypothetical protein